MDKKQAPDLLTHEGRLEIIESHLQFLGLTKDKYKWKDTNGDNAYDAFVADWIRSEYVTRFWTFSLTNDEKIFVFDQGLQLLAESEEQLRERQKLQTKLLSVAPVELEGKDLPQTHIQNPAQIEEMKLSGQLIPLSMLNVDGVDGHYAVPEMQIALNQIDKNLASAGLTHIFRMSSSVRSITQQSAFYKLGYPAVKLSYHTKGRAVDFPLSITSHEETPSFYERFNQSNGQFIKEEIDGILTGKYVEIEENKMLLKLNEYIKNGNIVNIENLVKAEILDEENEVVKVWKLLASIPGITVLDESHFFTSLLKPEVIMLNNSEDFEVYSWELRPVFHVQLNEKQIVEG